MCLVHAHLKEGIDDEEEISNALYLAFEERAKRFGYKGMRLSLDQEREKAHRPKQRMPNVSVFIQKR